MAASCSPLTGSLIISGMHTLRARQNFAFLSDRKGTLNVGTHQRYKFVHLFTAGPTRRNMAWAR